MNVVGSGPTALAIALLLARQGRSVRVVKGGRLAPCLPLVLNGVTLTWLGSLFGKFDLPGTWLTGAEVHWNGQPVSKAGLRLMIHSDRLAQALEGRLRELCPQVKFSDEPAADSWRVQASAFAERRAYGQRVALVGWVAEEAPRGSATMLVQSQPGAWLMATPDETRTACVVVVPSPPDQPEKRFLEVLQHSGWFAAPSLDSAVLASECAPAILDPALGERWLAVGDGAVRLDPLCGDGVGFGLRGAGLACACLASEHPRALEFYEARLRAAFAGHLAGCAEFYAGGAELERALPYRCDRPHPSSFGLSLQGDRLQAVSATPPGALAPGPAAERPFP